MTTPFMLRIAELAVEKDGQAKVIQEWRIDVAGSRLSRRGMGPTLMK